MCMVPAHSKSSITCSLDRLRHYRMPRHGSLMEGPYPNDPNRILIAGNYGFTW